MDKTQDRDHMTAIPVSIFDTADLPLADRLDAWKASFDVIFDYAQSKDVADNSFFARMENYLFEHFMLTDFHTSAADYRRDSRLIARDNVDMLIVQIYRRGPPRYFEHDRGQSQCMPGDVLLIDATRTMTSQHPEQHNLSLSIPRCLLGEFLPNLDPLHGTVLRHGEGLAEMLKSHIYALRRNVSTLDRQQSRALARPTLEIAAAAIRASLGQAVETTRPLTNAIRCRADEIIEANLKDFELSPEKIACQVPCSRSRLFGLYKPEGGVQRYISRRRLHAAFRELAEPVSRDRTVSTIADAWGFGSSASFCRAFRNEFGISPTEARLQAPAGFSHLDNGGALALSDKKSYLYERWITDFLSQTQVRVA